MAGQCRAEAGETATRHAHLSSSINTSVLDGWTDSQAAIRFTELYEQWRVSAQGVSEALARLGPLRTNVAGSSQPHDAEMAARTRAIVISRPPRRPCRNVPVVRIPVIYALRG